MDHFHDFKEAEGLDHLSDEDFAKSLAYGDAGFIEDLACYLYDLLQEEFRFNCRCSLSVETEVKYGVDTCGYLHVCVTMHDMAVLGFRLLTVKFKELEIIKSTDAEKAIEEFNRLIGDIIDGVETHLYLLNKLLKEEYQVKFERVSKREVIA